MTKYKFEPKPEDPDMEKMLEEITDLASKYEQDKQEIVDRFNRRKMSQAFVQDVDDVMRQWKEWQAKRKGGAE